jgi:putative endonuclease
VNRVPAVERGRGRRAGLAAGTSRAARGADAADTGRAAELAARSWLEARGLACLAANFRARVGELDLVMRDADVIAVVEVRYRATAAWGGAAASVDGFKQRRIVAATARLLALRPALARERLRFDVLAVSGTAPDWHFEWLQDAFRAD